MKSEDFISFFVHNSLGIGVSFGALSIFIFFVKNLFLKRSKLDMINVNVVFSKLFLSISFVHSTATVLKRSENSCWVVLEIDIFFVMGKFRFSQQLNDSSSKVFTHFVSCAGQLRQPFDNIAKSINVVNICSLNFISPCLDLLVLSSLNSSSLQVESISGRVSSDCKKDSVELFNLSDLSRLLIFDDDIQTAIFIFSNALGQRCLMNYNLSLLEIVDHFIDHIMIKRSQVISSSHHAHLVAHSSQKTSNLNANVPSSNHQSLSGSSLPIKYIVTRDCMLGSFNFYIRRSCSSRYHKIFCLDFEEGRILFVELREFTIFEIIVYYLWLFSTNKGLFVFEGCQTVEVIHVFSSIYFGYVPEVHRFYVHLYFFLEFLPVKGLNDFFIFFSTVDAQLPSIVIGVHEFFMILGGLVHEFFGDTAHIDTSTSESPFCFMLACLNIVNYYHAQPVLICFCGCCQSCRTAPDDCEIIDLIVLLGDAQRVFEQGVGEGQTYCSCYRFFDPGLRAGVGQEFGNFLPYHLILKLTLIFMLQVDFVRKEAIKI